MNQEQHKDKHSKLCVTTWATVIFWTIVTYIFNVPMSPIWSWLHVECFHYQEYIDVEESRNRHYCSLELSFEHSHSYKERSNNKIRLNQECEEDEEIVEKRRLVSLSFYDYLLAIEEKMF